MRIKTEVCDGCEDEILIRCSSRTETVRHIEAVLQRIIKSEQDIVLYSSGAEYYIPTSDVLFFESSSGKVYAHTAAQVFTTELKLFELMDILPASFARISKSAIANVMQISSLKRELVGNGALTFKNSNKSAYFSRAYYKTLRTKIDEMRLKT